ncbi:hypothetical protein [Sandaracinus amylolyticus]|uniref:Alpha/beta hydrolase n=1 Tax=Sandaracinus amylolyticus TaxID=927083 RepID=A0A0F6W9K7_9BACT|nr:hypothetical protein [Sandaracinus amylolyticus]AKF10886.1 hypothetical protein DB32_008035 [Sandaracinus amylolyticus]
MRRAIVVGCALLALGCVLPAPRSVRLEADASTLQPLARLGRWDGTRFVAVTPGSLPPSHLRVVVHGWAPGWGRAVRNTPSLLAWDAIDARGRRFEPWLRELAQTLAAHDPHTIVVAYSWLDDAATGRFPLAQRDAAAHVRPHGALLARAIEAATAPEFEAHGGQVHLLGHSYGARVASEAAVAMEHAPAQLTLFDAPDAPLVWVTGSHMHLAELLPALQIGWGAGRTFVENYVAMVGARYTSQPLGLGALVEVALAPPHGAFDYRHRHNYPMRFYASTAGTSFGLGWSPLTPGAQAPAPGCWEQRFGEIALDRGCSGL